MGCYGFEDDVVERIIFSVMVHFHSLGFASIRYKWRCRLHPVNDLSFVVEFVEILNVVPPLKQEFLTDQLEPWCELKFYRESSHR